MDKNKKDILQNLGYIFGILGILVLLFVIGFTSIQKGDEYKQFTNVLNISGLVLVGLSLILFGIFYRKELWIILTSRQARWGVNATAVILAFIGIISLLNYISFRHHARFDLTSAKTFTLSPQTHKILNSLSDEVKIIAFFSEGNTMKQQVKDLLDSYTYVSKKLKVEFIDPIKNPAVAIRYQITSDGTTIFECGNKKKNVTGYEEQQFTSAILSVTKETKPVIYFLQGHGELGIDDYNQRLGIAQLKSIIEKDNYEVKTLDLFDKTNIPVNCKVLVIAGPTKPIPEKERDAIFNYIQKGGRAIILLNPDIQTGIESVLHSKYGIIVGNNMVFDFGSMLYGDPRSPAVISYPYHEITKEMNRVITFFPGARTISLENNLPEGVTGSKIVETSPNSFGKANYKELKNMNFEEGKDLKGPVSIAVALNIEIKKDKATSPSPSPTPEKSENKLKARLVVFGNSNFISNAFSTRAGNADLFMNSLAWASEEEELISIRSKEPEQRKIELTNNQAKLIFNVTVFLIPVIVLSIGGYIWWKRR